MNNNYDKVMEQRARRAAKRWGWIICKSRDRILHCNNEGGFMIVEPFYNRVEAGVNYDMSPEDVIAWVTNNPSLFKQSQS